MAARWMRVFISTKAVVSYLSILVIINIIKTGFKQEVVISRSGGSKIQKPVPAPRVHLDQAEETFDGAKHENKAGYQDHFYQVNNENIFLYSGFLDLRYSFPTIRMFGMQSKNVSESLFCRFNGEDLGEQEDFPLEENFRIFDNWPSPKLKYLAQYYACAIPDEVSFSSSSQNLEVGVYAKGSNSVTNLKITPMGDTHSRRDTLGICVKAIWGSLDPIRLVEWVEFNRLLGVEKIVFYDSLALGKALRVLDYYKKEGFVDVIPFKFVQKMALLSQDDPMRRQLAEDEFLTEQAYLVSLNDCYYRYRDQYKYIMFLDIDEVIVPMKEESLLDVIRAASAEYPDATALNFLTAWHLEEYGKSNSTKDGEKFHLHMQQYLQRSAVMKSQPKAILHTDRAITVNWHGSVTMPSNHGLQGNVYLPWERYGFVHHFRKRCKHSKQKCQDMSEHKETDSIIPRYRTSLEKIVLKIVEKLHLGS